MQSYLKTRSVGSQFFIFLSLVASGLLIFVAMIGTFAAMKATGLSLFELSDVKNWSATDTRYLLFLRIMLAVQFVGLFVVPVLVFAYLSDPAPLRYLGLRKTTPFYLIAAVLLLVAALPLVEYLGALNQKIHFPSGIEGWMKSTEQEAQQQIGMLLKGRSLANLLLNIVMVAGFAGIGEELFFRGVLQRLAIWGFKNVWVGILVAAFLFSALHLQFYGFFPRFLLGILLGVIYWYSGSLWPSILAHFFYDALLITIAYYNPAMISDEQTSLIPSSAMLVSALASAVAVGALLYFMRKKSTASEGAFHQERSLNTPQSFTFEP
ncbi:MAG TPA: CPBP family intramembrane glutamic endopeptidase [Chitinophagaceae bacterium]|nr:CPBP family intramembrane glutamic endopeptidase [Chitinophagaceae bacterium]